MSSTVRDVVLMAHKTPYKRVVLVQNTTVVVPYRSVRLTRGIVIHVLNRQGKWKRGERCAGMLGWKMCSKAELVGLGLFKWDWIHWLGLDLPGLGVVWCGFEESS